jgi:hypothetical protein
MKITINFIILVTIIYIKRTINIKVFVRFLKFSIYLFSDLTMATTIEELFPESKTNLTMIKWAHRVNSQADLNKALESSKND